MTINLSSEELDKLFEYYNMILGYPPGVSDKLLIKKYATNYTFWPFDYQLTIEAFL